MATKLVSFHARTIVVEAMSVFLEKRISGVPVVDDEGKLIGILSEVDLMQVIVQDSYYDESIGTDVGTIDADMDIYTLAEKFVKERRRRYPVVSNGKLIGQISRRDVLRAAKEFLAKTKRKTSRL
jgi:CBS domain-containing protein